MDLHLTVEHKGHGKISYQAAKVTCNLSQSSKSISTIIFTILHLRNDFYAIEQPGRRDDATSSMSSRFIYIANNIQTSKYQAISTQEVPELLYLVQSHLLISQIELIHITFFMHKNITLFPIKFLF